MHNWRKFPTFHNFKQCFIINRYFNIINVRNYCDEADEKNSKGDDGKSKSGYKPPEPSVDHTTGTGLGTLKSPEGLMSDLASTRETEYFYKKNREAMRNMKRRRKLKMLEEELERLQKEHGNSIDKNDSDSSDK